MNRTNSKHRMKINRTLIVNLVVIIIGIYTAFMGFFYTNSLPQASDAMRACEVKPMLEDEEKRQLCELKVSPVSTTLDAHYRTQATIMFSLTFICVLYLLNGWARPKAKD